MAEDDPLASFMSAAGAISALGGQKMQQQQGMENLYEQQQLFPLKLQAAQMGVDQQRFDQSLNPLRRANMGLELSSLGLRVNSEAINLDLQKRKSDILKTQLPLMAKVQDGTLQNQYIESLRQKGQEINALTVQDAQGEVEGLKAVTAQNLVKDLYTTVGGITTGVPFKGVDLPVPDGATGTVYGTQAGGDPNHDGATNRGIGYAGNHIVPGTTVAMSPEWTGQMAAAGVPIHGATLRVDAKDAKGNPISRNVVVGDHTAPGLAGGPRMDLAQGDAYNAADPWNGANITGMSMLSPGVVDKDARQGQSVLATYNANIGALMKAQSGSVSLDAAINEVHDKAAGQAVADRAIGMLEFLESAGPDFPAQHPREAALMGQALTAVSHQPMVQQAMMSRAFEPMKFQLELQNVDPTTVQRIKAGIEGGQIRNQRELGAAVNTAQEQAKIRLDYSIKQAGKIPENQQWLTTQFNADERIQNFGVVNSAYQNIEALAPNLNGNEFNDLPLVDSLNRMFNPKGIVRPQTVELMTKMVPGWQNVWNALTNKPIEGGKLPPASRQAAVDLARTEIAHQRGEVKTAIQDWGRLSTNMGVPPAFLPQFEDMTKGIIGGVKVGPDGKPASAAVATPPAPVSAPPNVKQVPMQVNGVQKSIGVLPDGSAWLANGTTVPVGGAFSGPDGKVYKYNGSTLGFTLMAK